MSLGVVPFISIYQFYNATAFASISYFLDDYVWVKKSKSCSIRTPSSPKLHSFPPLHPLGTVFVVMELHLLEINSKLDTQERSFTFYHF